MKTLFRISSLLLVISLLNNQDTFAQNWKFIAPMKTSRGAFGATVMNDGKIMVVGGRRPSGVTPTAEIYDPLNDTWVETGALNVPKLAFPLVTLHNGRIYAPSGLVSLGTDMTETCEIYDPTTGQWSLTTPLQQSREGGGAIVLPSGKVLIVAGDYAPPGYYLRSAEVFDPVTTSVVYTDSISKGQFSNNLFLDTIRKKVTFFSGHYDGQHGTWLKATEEYDIATEKWSIVAYTQVEHGGGNRPAVLPNGDIVVPGGDQDPKGAAYAATDAIEIYTPSTHTWRTLSGKLRIARFGGVTAYMGGDSVIVIGGYSPTLEKCLDDCEIINVKTGAVTQGPKLNQARFGHWLAIRRIENIENPCCGELKIYVFGGEGVLFGSPLTSCEVLVLKGAAESPIAFPPSFTLEGSVCNDIDTAIVFKNIGCSSIIVDSVTTEGFEATVSGFPLIVKLDDEASIPLSISSNIAGSVSGNVRIYYRSGCSRLDTSITLTASFASSSKGTIRPIISDVPNGRDTVEIPLYLVNNSGDVFNAFEVVLAYNKNLLEAIGPRFEGTLAEGAPLADVTSTAAGATVFVPQTISLSVSKPLCILRFVSHLSDTTCTTVRLEGVRLEDANGNSCIYAVRKDSALICKTLAVGRNDGRSPCAPNITDLLYDRNTNMMRFTVDACTNTVSAELYDILGKQVYSTITSTGAEQQLRVMQLPTGVYSLVVRNFYGASLEKLVITQ